MPSVVSQTTDLKGAGKVYKGAPKVTNVSLYVQFVPPTKPGEYPWKLMPYKPRPMMGFGPQTSKSTMTAGFPSTYINTESHALHHGGANHDWHYSESPAFRKNTRIFGAPKIQIYSTIGREWVTVTPTLADVDTNEHVMVAGNHVATTDKNMLVGLTRGWLDSRYRDGLAKQKMLEPGKYWQADITAMPTDYTFLANHHLGLNIQTEILEWSLPKFYPGCDVAPQLPSDPTDPTSITKQESCASFIIDWEKARTRVILPVVNAPKNPANLFHPIGHEHGDDCLVVPPVCG
jgi:predicted acyl esterase